MDLVLLQKYRDTNGRRIVIEIGGVYTTLCQEEAYFCKNIAIKIGGVSRYFSKVSGSGVDLILLITSLLEGGGFYLIRNSNFPHWSWDLVATIHSSPFMGECFTDFLFIHGFFSLPKQAHSHIHLAIMGECFTHSFHAREYIHSIHASSGH